MTRLLVVAVVFGLGSSPLLPHVRSSGQDAVVRTKAFTAELHKRLDLPGLAVAVGVNGRIVASEAVGFADVEQKVALSRTHTFRIGSVSKLLTTSATLRLHQAGRLDLDAPLQRFVKDVPNDKASVTVRQMLGHLSGFGHYGATDYTNTTPYANVADVVPRLLAVPLVAPPGTRYAYSSYAFNVLGAALQIASGKEFRALVADEVTRPLAMTSTVAESPAVLKNRARLYSRGADNVLTSAAASDVTDRWPSGGFLSTAEDLVLFGMGFLQAGYLKTELRELAFTAQRLADGTETRVGLGWRIARDEDGRRYVHHGGDSIGGRAFLLVYPDAGVAVAILSNLSLASITEKDALALAHPFVTR